MNISSYNSLVSCQQFIIFNFMKIISTSNISFIYNKEDNYFKFVLKNI